MSNRERFQGSPEDFASQSNIDSIREKILDTKTARCLDAAIPAPFIETFPTDADYHLYSRSARSGGTAVIYPATAQTRPGLVALKVINSKNEASQTGFVAEAISQANINSRYVVPIHNIYRLQIEGNESVAIEMPWLGWPGINSLNEIINHKQRTFYNKQAHLEWAADVVDHVAQALEAGHCKNIIHRDLKLSNILYDGRIGFQHAQLLDYGISSLANKFVQSPNFVNGTPKFIAPESLYNPPKDPTPQVDILSLGVISYELLTLVPLRQEDDLFEMMSNVAKGQDEISIYQATETLSRATDQPHRVRGIQSVIGQAVTLKPEERYVSAKNFSRAYRRALLG